MEVGQVQIFIILSMASSTMLVFFRMPAKAAQVMAGIFEKTRKSLLPILGSGYSVNRPKIQPTSFCPNAPYEAIVGCFGFMFFAITSPIFVRSGSETYLTYSTFFNPIKCFSPVSKRTLF